ncbi:MAG: serine/threonine-protein kinase, partial [Polyangiales bacterium]
MWRAGQNLGGYELLAKLRDGGMATLFLARRAGAAGFARHVAIKVIHPALASDEQFRQMFLDEALVSSRIQHPNVVRVEELGQHESMHFLVMEFVHGCSLSQLQRSLLDRGRRLSPAFAVRIAMHVAEALHAAHEARDERGRLLNVVHRDVSPENVLLGYAGQVKLIDFGIARAHGRRHRTQDGLLKGKFRYMAPEQALGRPVDRRVDIYQLGIITWEMLTLRRMFDAERDVELLASVQRPRVAPPSAWVDGIPPELDVALMRALDPDPKSRPSDAQSFARLLSRALPQAHEVDVHALRSLLHGSMHEHRERERASYPAGVYDGLDRELASAAGQPLPAPASTVYAPEPRPVWCADTPTRPGPGA